MSWLSSFLHPEKGYQKGQEQLDKYYQQGQGYLQPYNQYGQNAYGNINEAMQALLNPEALQNKWIQGYEESPAAKQAEGMAQEHGLNAASSMGLMGSAPALQAIQAGTSQISMNDRQNYLDNLMQKYLAGAGIGQGIFNTGASSAGQMGQNAMNQGQNSAQMAFGKQNAQGDLFGKLLGSGVGLAGSYLGGGMSPAQQAWTTGGG
jgi:hypothetical protein